MAKALPLLCLALVGATELRAAELDKLLEPLRVAGQLPGLAAAVVRDGKVVAVGAVGYRKDGDPTRVTVGDRWHIGSCTKSMTATLAAMYVAEGKFKWDETLPQLFPKLAKAIRPSWEGVTLEQLLAHRGGAPGELNANGLWGKLEQMAGAPPLEQRAYLATDLLTRQDPAQAPGTFAYANSSYSLVGHALEIRLGQPWEKLLRERLFEPLGMKSCGFGMPASLGKTDQPWGHFRQPDGSLKPIPPGPGSDNPAAIGPGGTVHLSISDLATYAAFHLRGDREGHRLLSAGGFRKLHTRFAADGDYAMGWISTPRPWGGGDVLTHAGTNTTNYAVMWLAPKRNFAVVICTNADGKGVDAAVDKVAAALVQRFAPKD